MRHSTIILGERSLEGKYNRIFSAGEFDLQDSDVKSIYAAGDAVIKKSHIKKLHLAGELNAEDVQINLCKLAGEAHFRGICKVNRLIVAGELEADYLECLHIKNCDPKDKASGPFFWHGVIKSEIFENRNDLSLDFDYEFKKIISDASLFSEKEICCDTFYCLGTVSAPAVNAEKIFIATKNGSSLGEITGGRIEISSLFPYEKELSGMDIKKIPVCFEKEMIKVGGIFGDVIKVECVKAKEICGKDVVIGDMCVVDHVQYQNSIKISEKAVIGGVVKQ